MERADLIELVQRTGAAEEHGGYFFFCDPNWSARERAVVNALQERARARPVHQESEEGWLCIPTGGTTGGVRFARHDERTLTAAVTGFCGFFGIDRVNAIDVLPPYHVSGFMARLRCAATNGRCLTCDWRRLEGGERPQLSEEAAGWVISLVPTQLQRLLASATATEWLRGFRLIFVGGGPASPALTDKAAGLGLRIALTYGMTETAAMVAASKTDEREPGERLGFTALPHARFSLTADRTICIEGSSVFRGYFPELVVSRRFETEDLGEIDENGRIHVLGRKDAVIISGGKKVHPLEVEMALHATGEFRDVAIIGVPDVEWGEIVVACFPREETSKPDMAMVERGVAESLAPHKRPKRYVAITSWPRNAHGKLNRAELLRRVVAS